MSWINPEIELMNAYDVLVREGRKAFADGVALINNPYRNTSKSDPWTEGWCAAAGESMAKLGRE